MSSKKTWLKMFVKDFRRIRWPHASKITFYFFMSVLFVAVATGILFAFDITFTDIWNALGIGIND